MAHSLKLRFVVMSTLSRRLGLHCVLCWMVRFCLDWIAPNYDPKRKRRSERSRRISQTPVCANFELSGIRVHREVTSITLPCLKTVRWLCAIT